MHSFINPLRLNIILHTLHTVPYKFAKVLKGRICWTVKSFLMWNSRMMLKEEIRCWSLLGDQKVNADPLSAKENPQGLALFCDLGTLSAPCDYPSNFIKWLEIIILLPYQGQLVYITPFYQNLMPEISGIHCLKFQVFFCYPDCTYSQDRALDLQGSCMKLPDLCLLRPTFLASSNLAVFVTRGGTHRRAQPTSSPLS